MNRPKNQHWVPQFYLRHFATPETRDTDHAKAWVFSKEEAAGDETLASIRSICAKRYLYSPINEKGQRTWDLEAHLSTLEHTLGDLWPSLARDYVDISDSSVRKGVSLFVAATHLRHPDTLNVVEGIHRSLVRFYESMPRRPDGTPHVDSVEIGGTIHTLDASQWHRYRAWAKTDHHRFFAHFVRADAIHLAEILLGKRWSIVAAEHETFITGDKPVSINHQTKAVFGVKTPGVIVTFPVSPTRLLVMDDMHQEPANQYYALKATLGGAYNYHIWRTATRFMIAGRAIPEVLTELLAWTDSLAKRDA